MAQSNQEDDFQAAARAMEEDSGRAAKSPKALQRKGHRGLLIFAAVIGLAVLGGGAYWFSKHRSASTTPAVKSSTASTQQTGQAPTTPSSTTTTHYVSAEKTLSLEFDYPANWTVTPATTTAAGTQPIVVESVPATMTDATGASVTGKATITIRSGGATISELASGNATAAQDSVQIGYKHPTASQHQYPFLTFIHLTGGADPNAAFEEVMITGVQSFPKTTPVTTGSLGQLDPIITAAFTRCSAANCTGKAAGNLSIVNATWQNTPVLQQVLALFESLKLN